MTHAAPAEPREGRDGCPMDEQTEDLADTIENALTEVGGDSPLYRMMADHAARAVQLWIDYRLQRGELRVIVASAPTVVEHPSAARTSPSRSDPAGPATPALDVPAPAGPAPA